MSAEKDAWTRLQLLGQLPHDDFFSPTKAKKGYYSALLKDTLKAAPPTLQASSTQPETKPEPTFDERWIAFERIIQQQALEERNSFKRRARLLKAAHELELHRYINRQEISQRVLQAKDEQQGNTFKPLTAADRLAMDWPEVDWLIPDLIPANDLSIIGGQPKVGKTTLALSITAAVLTGSSCAGFKAPARTRPVILVSDDQGDADTAAALKELGIFDHPQLIWSRRFRLTESDLDGLLETIKAYPGAVVILDSLRSISRSLQHGENDPEIGAVIYDLKAAVTDAGGTPLVIHHCNKADGLTGILALSGHNAIGGAANTVVTMHYVADAEGKPDKQAPQRRLVKEGRTGEPLDLVISRTAGTPGFHQVGSYASWRQQAEESQQEARRQSKRTELQREVLELLDQQPGEWLTCREVVEALGLPFINGGSNKDACRVREALSRLATEEAIQRVRAGSAYTFSSVFPGHSEIQTPQTPQTPCSDWGLRDGPKTSDTSDTSDTPPGLGSGSGVSGVSGIGSQTPEPLRRKDTEVSEVSGPRGVGGLSPSTAPGSEVSGSEVSGVLVLASVGSGCDAFSDDDDPAWPRRAS